MAAAEATARKTKQRPVVLNKSEDSDGEKDSTGLTIRNDGVHPSKPSFLMYFVPFEQETGIKVK